MNCPLESQENAQVLLDYCIRQRGAESDASLERHIAICHGCQEFARHQRAVWNTLDAWKAAPVSPDFDSRLYRRIDAQISWWNVFLRPLKNAALRRSLPAAAMACLLLVAGVMLELPTAAPVASPATPPSDTAQVDTVQPEQVEHALDAMDMLNAFSQYVKTERPNSKL